MRRRNIDTRKFSERRASGGCHSCRRAAQQPLEIFDFPGSNKDLEKASRAAWPNVTYKGKDIVKFIMYVIDQFENDMLVDGDSGTGGYDNMQEVYGGYDIKSDRYYIGFDGEEVWLDGYYGDWNTSYGWYLFEFSPRGGWFDLVEKGSGTFYRNGGYKEARSLGIADLRLD